MTTQTLNGTISPVTSRPVPRAVDWRASANCATTDPDLFHPDGVGGTVQAQERDALLVCGRCEVRAQCLAWAVDTRQNQGVWGGTTERQRRRMVRRPAERQLDRCLNAQEWIEAELAEGRTQKSIADELGVDKAAVNRAVKEFRFGRYLGSALAEGATV